MISIELQNHLINVAVRGQFTLTDFKKLEEAIRSKISSEGRITLILDLRGMTESSVDVAWEEIHFAREYRFDLWKVAVVTRNPLVAWSAWLVGLFSPAKSQVFEDYNQAREWVSSS